MDKEDHIEQVRKAILNGNIEFTPRVEEAIKNMKLGDPNYVPDFTLTTVTVQFWGPFKKGDRGNGGGMGIDWATKSAGCGRADFRIEDDGKIHCYNQDMDKKFLATLFDYILEHTELDSVYDKKNYNTNPK